MVKWIFATPIIFILTFLGVIQFDLHWYWNLLIAYLVSSLFLGLVHAINFQDSKIKDSKWFLISLLWPFGLITIIMDWLDL